MFDLADTNLPYIEQATRICRPQTTRGHQVNSIGEVFALPRFSGTKAAMLRCTHVDSGNNQRWMQNNKTGIWDRSRQEDQLQTVIVLLDAADADQSGNVEVWAGRFMEFRQSPDHAPLGYYHVDRFELIGLTKKQGLQAFCSGYCKGPQPGLVYLEAKGNESEEVVSPDGPYVDDFRPEFSGEKEVNRPESFTADCLHGRVVTALYERLKEQNPLRRFHNRNRVDLLMEEPDGTRTLFEVKSSSDSQSVYTGIGQLCMYNLVARAMKKALVLPTMGESWRNKLIEVDIELWTFSGEGETFQSPSKIYRYRR